MQISFFFKHDSYTRPPKTEKMMLSFTCHPISSLSLNWWSLTFGWIQELFCHIYQILVSYLYPKEKKNLDLSYIFTSRNATIRIRHEPSLHAQPTCYVFLYPKLTFLTHHQTHVIKGIFVHLNYLTFLFPLTLSL